MDEIRQKLFDSALKAVQAEYAKFDEQVVREVSKIKWRGEITPAKLKRHGFKVISQQGVGRYMTKNGVRVTDIFFIENGRRL